MAAPFPIGVVIAVVIALVAVVFVTFGVVRYYASEKPGETKAWWATAKRLLVVVGSTGTLFMSLSHIYPHALEPLEKAGAPTVAPMAVVLGAYLYSLLSADKCCVQEITPGPSPTTIRPASGVEAGAEDGGAPAAGGDPEAPASPGACADQTWMPQGGLEKPPTPSLLVIALSLTTMAAHMFVAGFVSASSLTAVVIIPLLVHKPVCTAGAAWPARGLPRVHYWLLCTFVSLISPLGLAVGLAVESSQISGHWIMGSIQALSVGVLLSMSVGGIIRVNSGAEGKAYMKSNILILVCTLLALFCLEHYMGHDHDHDHGHDHDQVHAHGDDHTEHASHASHGDEPDEGGHHDHVDHGHDDHGHEHDQGDAHQGEHEGHDHD